MARKPKKYHYIYKTTCKITGKFYVGMHSTDNLEDGYLGSGKILGYSRKKYGDENHVREILEFCSSRDELKQREKEIVNEELLANPLNINLKYGGEGGWDHLSADQLKKFRRAGWESMMNNRRNLPIEERSLISDKITATRRLRKNFLPPSIAAVEAARVSQKRKDTMKLRCHSVGSKNANFGKRNACVSKNGIRKRISLDQLQSFLDEGWIRGLK
jgi:hypothetical protein